MEEWSPYLCFVQPAAFVLLPPPPPLPSFLFSSCIPSSSFSSSSPPTLSCLFLLFSLNAHCYVHKGKKVVQTRLKNHRGEFWGMLRDGWKCSLRPDLKGPSSWYCQRKLNNSFDKAHFKIYSDSQVVLNPIFLLFPLSMFSALRTYFLPFPLLKLPSSILSLYLPCAANP